jgi:hypothetical protein
MAHCPPLIEVWLGLARAWLGVGLALLGLAALGSSGVGTSIRLILVGPGCQHAFVQVRGGTLRRPFDSGGGYAFIQGSFGVAWLGLPGFGLDLIGRLVGCGARMGCVCDCHTVHERQV